MSAQTEHPLQLATAYGVCRHITRAAAKNFYYAFTVLPRRKRNALSAVYAFMREADDISDDTSLSIAERRVKLSNWLNAYHDVAAGGSTDDPVFLALKDSQQQYNIPTELLDQLVRGTAMDLLSSEREPGAPVITYQTFEELYDYCYHVASVVGLVCIRVFGYRDPAAEPLAEKVGIAFQLTNIIRDVREDAAMGRVYIPEADLQQFGLTAADILQARDARAVRPVLELEANRAREFYRAADDLLPLIDESSQPALWVLVTIYHRLLDKIAARNYDVFSERVRLSVREKSTVLMKGMIRRLA